MTDGETARGAFGGYGRVLGLRLRPVTEDRVDALAAASGRKVGAVLRECVERGIAHAERSAKHERESGEALP